MVTSDFRPEVKIWPYRTVILICSITIILMAESPEFLYEQFSHCGLGYGADTMFHRMHF